MSSAYKIFSGVIYKGPIRIETLDIEQVYVKVILDSGQSMVNGEPPLYGGLYQDKTTEGKEITSYGKWIPLVSKYRDAFMTNGWAKVGDKVLVYEMSNSVFWAEPFYDKVVDENTKRIDNIGTLVLLLN